MTTALALAGHRPPLRVAAVLRIAFGLVWAIDATLKWLPGFRASFGSMLDAAAVGQPGWLRPWFSLWTGLPHPAATALAYATAVTETAIAVAVLAGVARFLTYVLAGGYSLLVWATAEGFGGPYRAGATDIGTAVIYAFVFLGLIVLSAATGPDRLCLDRYLERRVDWWWRVAEGRRTAPVPRGPGLHLPNPRTMALAGKSAGRGGDVGLLRGEREGLDGSDGVRSG